MVRSQQAYEVRGKIAGQNGSPVPGARVVVWQQEIRGRNELATGETGKDGSYHIRYSAPQDVQTRLLIVVEAVSEHLSSPLMSSVVEAEQSQEIDLSLEQLDKSEWTSQAKAIAPLLKGLALSAIVENDEHNDISFLAQALNHSTEMVMRLAVSARLEATFKIPAAVFYAFIRQQVPPTIPRPLLDATHDFILVDSLVQNIGSLIFALPPDLQQSTISSAIALDLIGPRFTKQIPEIVAQFQTLRSTDLLNRPYLVGNTTLGQLLTSSGVTAIKQQAFSQALATNSQSTRTFWRTLGDGKHGFTPEEASVIERTLSVGAFVKNFAPLVQALVQKFTSGNYKTLPDLARLTLQDWETLVNQTGPPPGIDAAPPLTPAQVFAKVVYARVTRAYPTAALSSRISTAIFVSQAQQQPLIQFFQNNPALELTKDNIPAYLRAQGAQAFNNISQSDRGAVIANARAFQRVLRVAPDVDISQTLLNLGIQSATQIATLGSEQFFLKATAAGLSKPEADLVYKSAAQRYANAIALYMRFNIDAAGVWPAALGQISDLNQAARSAVQNDPTLSTLFGSLDYCAVDDCTSVLSPAAYLCDLLMWLRNHPLASGQTALDVLDSRRPDIRHLLLNCPNSDTELPYIDLVNELLADKISPPANPDSTINPPWKQTSPQATETQLRAAPEYFNQQTYVTLFGASYPQSLPYSAGLDELRTYLQQTKLPLWQLRQALLPVSGGTPAQQATVAAERFGMNLQAENLITVSNFVAPSIAWDTSDFSATPGTGLATIPVFLQAATITYESLLELLELSWVQGTLGITIQGVDDTCNTSVQALTPAPLDAGFLDRAHRFLRLWRSTGYKMWELDLLLRAQAVGGSSGTIDQAALAALFTFRHLQDATGLPVDRQLAFYQNFDTNTHRDPDGSTTVSLYAQIFLNAAVTSVASDPDLAALVSGGTITNPNLSSHVAAIQAALGVSAWDAAILISLTNSQLTLDNLSFIYRVNALAIASKFTLSDFLAVAMLLSPGASNQAAALAPLLNSPSSTLAFLAQAKAIQQSSLTIDAITYLLTPPNAALAEGWATATQMTEADIATALDTVRLAALAPTSGNLNGVVIAAVAANAHGANVAGVANDVTSLVLNALQVPGTAQTLLAVLTDAAFTASTTVITNASFKNQFLAIRCFDKVSLLIRGLRLVATDLAWLLANAAVYGGLDLTQLPVASGQSPLNLPSLLTTLLVIKLARLFTAATPQSSFQTLYDVIAQVHAGTLADEASTQTAIFTITGWPVVDIAALASALGFTFPTHYTQPASYDALRTLEAMASLSAATGAQLVSWGAVPPDELTAQGQAASALGALKARQTNNDAWLALAPSLMDPIRERRSSALQAYLIGQRDSSGNLIYRDANGLFDYFLIDVQMSSCQKTSRIVQAYIAVQIFVERCLMNLESPTVVVSVAQDDTWNQWEWMKRYRIWEANREVFLYPENWLIESVRPNRTEIYQKFEQEVQQNQSTTDYLESVVGNYIDRLDGLAHLVVTGTCEDPATGTIHVVARTLADPPVFYLRSFVSGAWTGWTQIPMDIQAAQVVPAIHRGRICLFWLQIGLSTEPNQALPSAQQSSTPPTQNVDKYVGIGLYFSVFRNGNWTPGQAAKGKLYDKPFLDTTGSASNAKAVEALYSLKIQAPTPSSVTGSVLFVEIYRLGKFDTSFWGAFGANTYLITGCDRSTAVHLARVVFDGRFSDLGLRNAAVPWLGSPVVPSPPYQVGLQLLGHAQQTYGPDAQPLLPLPDNQANPDLQSEPGQRVRLLPLAGALMTDVADAAQSSVQTQPLTFTSTDALAQNVGPLLNTAQIPFRVVGPSTDLNFGPASYFIFQDNRRSYFVDSTKYYSTGSMSLPVAPSQPYGVPYEIRNTFHVFYHPFTRLFWNQLASGGFDSLYDPNLQQNPDQIDPSGGDALSFQNTYQPTWRVQWDLDIVNGVGQDRQFLDFSYDAAFSVYNWELFYHVPLYVAQLLSQNQQFEDAQTWFHYIFNPTRQGSDSVPQRFWIPKPLHDLTSAQILQQQINQLLLAVNQGDPTAIAEVESWRNDPFNPFLLADQRNVAYMKSAVMSYLDNLIAWGDNLFSTDSREALSEATLLYVTASEMLGSRPVAVTPPQHADQSFDQLEPLLDAFANAWVEIENSVGGTGSGSGGSGGGLPGPHTFYFKIPPNDKLLGYWDTVADRLYKLRHCQDITGAQLQLALFDAPIDPGLLVRAQAAGVDLSSVLADITAPPPNYRFTALYPQALDFVNAVRAYGSSLQAALEKADSGALALMQQRLQKQLLSDGNQVLDWQVQQAQSAIDALTAAQQLAQDKHDYNASQEIKPAEEIGAALHITSATLKILAAAHKSVGALVHLAPLVVTGASGFGGSPIATIAEGGKNVGDSTKTAGLGWDSAADATEICAFMATTQGSWYHREDDWGEAVKEAQDQIDQTKAQLVGAGLELQIRQNNQSLHQEQIDNLQKQIDFLNTKFTNDDLYTWMANSLAATYFQSYQLAYQMCKQVERCYQFELGIDTTFIQFGYWDSLYKGLLAGETLNHDLRTMQSSYLQENVRRFELSRFISLGQLDPVALQQLLVTGSCDFTLPELLFDNDYPGHYNRRLVRVSVTVVYPSPGKFDNIKATLIMVSNKVRVQTDVSGGYPESSGGSDSRFVYNYAAVPQKIALGNAQDDPGLFITAIAGNIVDQRYLPFENAGAISSWHLEMPQINNEVDISTVGDVVLHIYYTALDGGSALAAAVQSNNAANMPTSGSKLFSAQNDFAAPSPPTVDNPYPLTPWQAFLGTQKGLINALTMQVDGTPRWQVFNNPPSAGTADTDQLLTLKISPAKFPAWTRGKTIAVASITVLVLSWQSGNFVLVPQAPLPATPLTLTPVPGITEPNVCSAAIAMPANSPLGTWSFKLQRAGAADFRSLTTSVIGDVFLLVNYAAN